MKEKARKRAIEWAITETENYGYASPTKGARKFGVVTTTFTNWMDRSLADGWEGLRDAKRKGKSRLTLMDLNSLSGFLDEGAKAHGHRDDYWTLPMIQRLILSKFSVSYHPAHVSKILRFKLGYTSQKPQRVAKEKDQNGVRTWVKSGLPRIQNDMKKEDTV